MLTASRLLLLPVAFLPFILHSANYWAVCAAIALVAGLTDLFDGFVARKAGQTTAFGAHLDLISDKVFVCGMLVLLYWAGAVAAWAPAVVIAREAAISLVRGFRFRGRTPVSDALGKAKTALSMAAIVWVLLWADARHGGPLSGIGSRAPLSVLLPVAPWAMLAAVALTIVSGANYLVKWRKSNPLP